MKFYNIQNGMEDLKIVSRVFCDISHCIVGCLVFYRSSWRFDIWCYIAHNIYKIFQILTMKITESKIDICEHLSL